MHTKIPESLDYTLRLAIWESMRSTILRCADVVANTTQDQVRAAQAGALARGRSLLEVGELSRADVATAKLRLLAKQMESEKPVAPVKTEGV